MEARKNCDACGSADVSEFRLCRRPIVLDEMNSGSMRVTNKEYGTCLETVRCGACGLIQAKHLLDSHDIVKLYAGMEDEVYLASSHMRGQSNYDQVIGFLKRRLPPSARVLEIGAGSGALVSLLRRDFPATEGLEPSRFFCERAKEKYGVDLMNIPVEELKAEGEYDAVVALDVIEHVTSPDRFMGIVKKILKPGGIAVIVTPNVGSVTARLLGARWWHIRPPHLYYFNDRSFRILAARHDLKIVARRLFRWKLPLHYLADSLQRLVFGRPFVDLRFARFNVVVNTLDSRVYVLEKL